MSRPVYAFDVRARDVWAIALPASVAFITEPLAGLVDISVVGRLGDPALLGGTVLGALVFDYIFSLAYFLRIGTAGLTAQAVGARDPDDGLLHVARAIVLAIGIGTVMLLAQGGLRLLAEWLMAPGPGVDAAFETYFDVRIWSAPFSLVNYALLGWFYGRARARTGMLLQLVIHGFNIVLSIALVSVFHWGVAGAALGTVIGQAAACIVGLNLLVAHFGGPARLLSRIDRAHILDRQAIRRMLGMSRDLMLRSMALMTAYGYIAAQGSRMGDVTLSANAILLNFLMISGFFLDGIAQAAEQLSGKAVGANWRPAFDRAYGLTFRIGLAFAIGLSALWFGAGHVMIDVMSTSPEVRELAYTFLWVAALSSITGMPAFLYDGILVGVTLNQVMRNGMIVALAVFLVAAWVLQTNMGNLGLWLAIHIFFLARAAYYWLAVARHRATLFS